MVFAGSNNAIFSGRLIAITAISNGIRNRIGKAIPLNCRETRVSSFADCAGKLYAGVYDTIYERVDGLSPAWRKVFETNIASSGPLSPGFAV